MIGMMVGPIVLTMVQTAIYRGKRDAFIFAIAVWLSDAGYIYLTHVGLSVFLAQDNVKVFLGLGGGILLISMGAFNLFSPAKNLDEQTPNSNKMNSFFTGILINIFNPFVIAMWIGLYAYLQNQEATGNEKLQYFVGFMVMIMIMDTTRIWIATKFKRFLSGKRVIIVKRLAGMSLMIFGVLMLYRILS